MTVKPYIFRHVNILTRNRRAVVVVEADDGLFVGLVIVGGVTVDSIRLEPQLKPGAMLRRGQKIGAFARGGSAIAMFFSRKVQLVEECAQYARGQAGMAFKLECGQSLCGRD